MFLEESKYVIKEKKITGDVVSSDSNEDNFDEEILEKIQTKKNPDEEESNEQDSSEKDSRENKKVFFLHTNISISYLTIEINI